MAHECSLKGTAFRISGVRRVKPLTALLHDWEPTDTQGYEMACLNCGLALSIYHLESWSAHRDALCSARLEACELLTGSG